MISQPFILYIIELLMIINYTLAAPEDITFDPFYGNGNVFCPTQYTAISCGISSLISHDYEHFWGVWPSNNKYECNAYNHFGGTVYAMCVPDDIISESQISVVSSPYQGIIDVSCPSGSQVTGCGSSATTEGHEKWRQIFANDDGNSCHCYNYFGGTCYATCANNLNNWRKYTETGTGTLSVSCQGESLLLGCGINLHIDSVNHNFEKYPAFYPSNNKECKGYSHYSYDLYAYCAFYE